MYVLIPAEMQGKSKFNKIINNTDGDADSSPVCEAWRKEVLRKEIIKDDK